MEDEDIFTDEQGARLFTVIHMFQRSALVNLGFIADHEGTAHWNPTEAKEAIDILAMFQEKMKGNLHSTEEQLLKGVVSELQMQFVKAPEYKKQREKEEAEAEIARQAFTKPQNGPAEELVSENEEE
tara:strand:- start:381 stop:761 length:381 start_codon:yes stop_codon:yes gene_type:complete